MVTQGWRLEINSPFRKFESLLGHHKLSDFKPSSKNSSRLQSKIAMLSYGGIFMLLFALIAFGYYSPKQKSATSLSSLSQVQKPLASASPMVDVASVDQLIATKVAADIAERTELPIARNIAERSTTLSLESRLAVQSDSNAIVKQQIVEIEKSDREIRDYVATEGDTVDKIADKFKVSVDTIKWANNLSSNNVEAGKKLQIPPVDSIIYVVKNGDSVKSLADRYKIDEKRIELYNDLEVTGIQVGQKIVLPGGDLPANERPGYVAPVVRSSTSYTPTRYGAGFDGSRTWTIGYGTAGNKYAYGNCTAYAYNRRVQLGKPVGQFWGNASSWAYYAQSEGLSVTNHPSVGAILQNGGGYGHVGIVEEILPNGDISISEMNAYVPGGGFNIVSGRIIPASSVGSYNYIH